MANLDLIHGATYGTKRTTVQQRQEWDLSTARYWPQKSFFIIIVKVNFFCYHRKVIKYSLLEALLKYTIREGRRHDSVVEHIPFMHKVGFNSQFNGIANNNKNNKNVQVFFFTKSWPLNSRETKSAITVIFLDTMKNV